MPPRVEPPLGPPPITVAPRAGMVYVPPGALVVGTPAGERPWRADREPPGEQVMLEGFYIDRFPYPNEEGAIVQTSVTFEEARALCERQDKRLCSELEWERACKGPDNNTYEYGARYDERICETGRPAELRPSGYHAGCQSDFGVRDLHGGPFEWTASSYARGTGDGEMALRGGNDRRGDVVGRCANVEPSSPTKRSPTLGFRCCAGPKNEKVVELAQSFRAGLVPRARFSPEVEASLVGALSADVKADLEQAGHIESHRVWLWRPVANDELHLVAYCGRGRGDARGPRCGLSIARVAPGAVTMLAFVPTGRWVAALHRPGPHEYLWVVGGDTSGSFKRLVRYRFAEVEVGEPSAGAPKNAKSDD